MKKKDLIIIGSLLLLCAIIAVIFSLNRKPGDTVVVKIDKEVYGEYDLNKQNVVSIPAADGFNTLTISGGVACVTDADCPDRICVEHMSIYKKGQTIVCLPHKVSISIK